jgi:hypothetical protein
LTPGGGGYGSDVPIEAPMAVSAPATEAPADF